MSVGKVATAIDKVTPKTPDALRVVFSKPAGNEASLALVDINAWDYVTKEMLGFNIPTAPFIYNLPANSKTPIIIDFVGNTIKFGTDTAIDIGVELSYYQQSPDIEFELIIDSDNTDPKPPAPWISNKLWSGSGLYKTLLVLTVQPDTDTGVSGGLTLDNINIIIKP